MNVPRARAVASIVLMAIVVVAATVLSWFGLWSVWTLAVTGVYAWRAADRVEAALAA